MENPHWPLFGLRIRTPRLELRYPDDALLVVLATLAAQGIHDPTVMPFGVPWTDVASPEFERNSYRHWWRNRVEFSPARWSLDFVVVHDELVIGVQDVRALDFAVTRQVETGSWLGRAHQGQGFGKEMRAAVLHFAFAALGAEWATSGAFHDNPASQRVSESAGYEPDGIEVKARRGAPAVMQRYRLSRDRWERHRPPYAIDIEGLDGCRDWFGVAP